MGLLFKKYKTKFRYALQPLFAMIVGRRKTMDYNDWEDMILRAKISILNNPIDFLGTDLPDESLVRDVIDEIFYEFMKEQVQKKKQA